jgi:hypothetical protein
MSDWSNFESSIVIIDLRRDVRLLAARLSALEARAQAEPPKPERKPGWYPVGGCGGYPTCFWWSGEAWMTSLDPRAFKLPRQDLTVLGPRLDIPDEKVM